MPVPNLSFGHSFDLNQTKVNDSSDEHWVISRRMALASTLGGVSVRTQATVLINSRLNVRTFRTMPGLGACLLVGCLTSQQQASVSQGRICSDNFTCCHTEIQVADQTFYLTPSQYTDTGPTSPSADPTTPGAWQGSHWSANF